MPKTMDIYVYARRKIVLNETIGSNLDYHFSASADEEIKELNV